MPKMSIGYEIEIPAVSAFSLVNINIYYAMIAAVQ